MQIVKILGYSHLIIAFGAGVTAYMSGLALGLGDNLPFASYIIFSCTGLGYTVQRFIKTHFFPHSAPPERIVYMKNYGPGLTIGWTVILIVCIWWADVEFSNSTLGLGLLLIILGTAYAAIPLREKPYLKLPLIAIVFAIATVVYPALLIGFQLSEVLPLLSLILLARVLYIAGITIPFDVRDLKLDSSNMKTLPQQMGTRRSLQRAVFLVSGSCVLWTVAVVSGGVNPVVGGSLIIHSLVTIPFVSPLVAGKNRNEFYYSIVLDGLISFQFVILLLCYLLFQL
ncbi:MAG: hypothetical protein ACKVJ6_03580 [Flavobacteriales bacterium]